MGFFSSLMKNAANSMAETGIKKSREMAAMVARSDPEKARELLDKARPGKGMMKQEP